MSIATPLTEPGLLQRHGPWEKMSDQHFSVQAVLEQCQSILDIFSRDVGAFVKQRLHDFCSTMSPEALDQVSSCLFSRPVAVCQGSTGV